MTLQESRLWTKAFSPTLPPPDKALDSISTTRLMTGPAFSQSPSLPGCPRNSSARRLTALLFLLDLVHLKP